MKSNIYKIIASFILITFFSGCNQDQPKFELTGKLNGIKEGKIFLSEYNDAGIQKTDTLLINNGEFKFVGNIPEPVRYA